MEVPMARPVLCPLILLSLLGLAAGCGGLSTEESKQRCDQAKADLTNCMDDAAYDACVSCYEECGDDCTVGESCPYTFACAE
jgi:hypothetical protein